VGLVFVLSSFSDLSELQLHTMRGLPLEVQGRGANMSIIEDFIWGAQAHNTYPMMDNHSRHEKAFVDLTGPIGDHAWRSSLRIKIKKVIVGRL
jgi:hypothetical protein